MNIDPVITVASAVLLSYIFIAASIHKWQDLQGFRETLANYRVVPEATLPLAVYLVPALEFACGVALLLPPVSALAALLAGALLSVYMYAIGINLLIGRRSIDCGCGGSEQKQAISEVLITRNAGLLILCWTVVSAAPTRELAWLDWLIAVLASAIACLLYNIFNQLLVNHDLLKVFRNHA